MLIGNCQFENRLMSDIVLKFGRPSISRTLKCTVVWALLLVLLGLVDPGSAAAATGARPAIAAGPGLTFAIADFDGDRRADSANVQSGSNGSSATNYRIQLQLSEAGRQSIQLLAPAGGLRIEARDINGDNAVDLVLSTAWFRKPVAIFLNDGHGNFSRSETSAFPGAFSRDDRSWGSSSSQQAGAIGAPPRSRDSVRLKACELSGGLLAATPLSVFGSEFLYSRFLISHAGRAPPSEASL
jgi:hypothetical protein